MLVQGLIYSTTALTATYNQGISLTQGDPVTNTISGIAWPSTSSATISSKLVFKFTGGQVALLTDPSSLSISGLSLLFYFKNSLTYVFQAPSQGAGTVTFTINNLNNPYNYQSATYGTPQTAIFLYSAYNLFKTWSVTQPAFAGTFAARTMQYTIQPNSPSFDTDIYSGSEGKLSYG